jgi:sensor histidine kinase YesM
MFFASKYSTKRVTARLEIFIDKIGNDDALLLNEEPIQVSDDEEVMIIEEKFKELLSRINDLYAETVSIKLQKSAFELELLQSRINPHLLYNSLSVIKWNAQWNKDHKTIELIDSMVKYYRAALNKGNNIIKIEDELQMIKEYIKINEFSYSCKYEVRIDFDDRITGYYTIKHLLQPVVENSILHGLNGVEGGKISIVGVMEGGDIIIYIGDNGNGMDRNKVEQITDINYNNIYGGYGIKNLVKRINMYYGSGYGLYIESQIGKGTTVTIRIKALGEKELVEKFNLL